MAARDRFKVKIECPNCNQEGIFHMSEDDHPYMRNPHREVDKIDGEFTASVSKGVHVKITCLRCDSSFSY